MPEIIISDTSCLILLSKINEFNLLKVCYNKVVITSEISLEFGQSIPEWIETRDAKDKPLQKTLERMIGMREASATALAFEFKDCLLILDDRKARKIAKSLDFKITGVLGVIVHAKELGIIPSIKPILNKLAQTDFRISDKIIKRILEIVGEN